MGGVRRTQEERGVSNTQVMPRSTRPTTPIHDKGQVPLHGKKERREDDGTRGTVRHGAQGYEQNVHDRVCDCAIPAGNSMHEFQDSSLFRTGGDMADRVSKLKPRTGQEWELHGRKRLCRSREIEASHPRDPSSANKCEGSLSQRLGTGRTHSRSDDRSPASTNRIHGETMVPRSAFERDSGMRAQNPALHRHSEHMVHDTCLVNCSDVFPQKIASLGAAEFPAALLEQGASEHWQGLRMGTSISGQREHEAHSAKPHWCAPCTPRLTNGGTFAAATFFRDSYVQ